ncbi:MAG TPA: DUF4870 domain-containing protein [Candidatus Angelobacter sp.]
MAQMAAAISSEPTQDDLTMATLAHALSILGFIAPLVIFLVKRQSRFVSFHALQALLWQIAYFILIMVAMVGWLVMMFFMVAQTAVNKGAAPPVGIFVLFPLFWLLLMGGGICNLIFAIVYSIKASRGEWANYPIFGRLARKFLKMGPTGAGMV